MHTKRQIAKGRAWSDFQAIGIGLNNPKTWRFDPALSYHVERRQGVGFTPELNARALMRRHEPER